MISPVKVEGLVKSYGSKKNRVLDGVSFDLEPGKVLGLLGPNGAGKTTLIKIILGLVKQDEGKVWLFGNEGIGRESKQNLGFLPEESYLYSFLTIRETLQLSVKLYKKTGKKTVDEMLSVIGLSKFGDRKISECSKGMKRRAALGQALIHDPEVLILDEPTSGYDPIGMREVKDLIQELKREGKSILISSHQLAEVQDLCDGIVMLHQGKVVAQGSLETLLKQEQQYLVPEEMMDDEVKAALIQKGWEPGDGSRPSEDLESFFVNRVKDWESFL
jgi:ABC-2 type transport system ATP-binding protein